MLDFLYTHALTVAAIAACALAWWKGGRAEKAGAVVIFGGWMLSLVVYGLAVFARSPYAPYVPFAADGLVAIGFLGLALRYASGWLGVAVFLQAAELALHAAFLTGDGSGMRLYFARVNFLSLAIIILFLAATLIAWRRRVATEAASGAATPTGAALAAAAAGSAEGGDGFPRQAFDAAPVAVPHRLVRR